MKKIAIISNGFTGSILPLAKNFCIMGDIVHLYMCTSGEIIPLEACDCKHHTNQRGIVQIPINCWQQTSKYIDSTNFNFFNLSITRPFKNIPVLKTLFRAKRYFEIKQICKEINKENYDLVNIVGQYWDDDFSLFVHQLKGKTIVSLHEVCNHFRPEFTKPSKLLRKIIEKNTDVITFSENSKKDILKYKGFVSNKVTVIHFGLFESYKIFSRDDVLLLPPKFFLFFGALLPYKGVDVLINASKILAKKDYKINVVIAGGSYDLSLDTISEGDRITLINRYIDNEELAYMLKRSYAVICPYKTASQSGIPQTAYVYKKPIIASKIDSFYEIIPDKVFGIYSEVNNAESLANSMIQLWSESSLYNSLVNNLDKFDEIMPQYSWKNITDAYHSFIH